MAKKVGVFISHHQSRDEDAFTARLADDLERAGADVWVDKARITSDDFVKKINEGLAGRQWLVLVMTPDALRSQWVQAEVNAALNLVRKGKMLGVIPLMAKPCNDADIPPLWDSLHRYDATRDYQTAVSFLLGAIGLTTSVRPSAGAPPTSVRPAQPVTSAPSSTAKVILPPRLKSLGFQAKVAAGIDFILPPLCSIPAGEFLMGTDPKKDKQAFDRGPDEKPQHRVNVPAFKIGRYPVTVAEYACFVRFGHKEPRLEWRGQVLSDWQQQLAKPDHPVAAIEFDDAVAYAAWLTQLTGQLWLLPNEAEWEKAARGADGRIYPWGDKFDKRRCNTSESRHGDTTPVGTYPRGASPYGVQDMAGNVFEWTRSANKPYPYSSSDGREDPAQYSHIARGGNAHGTASTARAAFRQDGNIYVSGGRYLIGFRLVLVAAR